MDSLATFPLTVLLGVSLWGCGTASTHTWRPSGGEATQGAGGKMEGVISPKQGKEGSRCSEAVDCDDGLTCQRGSCTSGPRISYVSGCDDDLDCSFPLLCQGGVCQESGNAAGEPCDHDSDCVLMHACIEGTCKPMAEADVHSPSSAPGSVMAPPADLPTMCQHDYECPGAHGCVLGFCTPTNPPDGLGALCESDADCGEDQGCYMDTCQSIDGGADVGQPCSYIHDCNHGLVCREDACTRRHGAGQACIHAFDCEPDYECVAGDCAIQGASVGEACTDTQECFSESDIVVCLDGACTPIGDGHEGEVCEISEDCIPPLECNAYLCQSGLAAIEEPCFDDDHCQGDAYCVAGRCSENLLPLGAKCEKQLDCQSELCVKGKCRDYLDLGAKCTYNTECWSLLCINGRCSAEKQMSGQKCKMDADCEIPLICVKGKCRGERSDVGGPCSTQSDCVPGLACKLGKCRGE